MKIPEESNIIIPKNAHQITSWCSHRVDIDGIFWVFSLILDSSVGLSAGIQSAGE